MKIGKRKLLESLYIFNSSTFCRDKLKVTYVATVSDLSRSPYCSLATQAR